MQQVQRALSGLFSLSAPRRSFRTLLEQVNAGARTYHPGKVPIYPTFEAVRRVQIRRVKPFDKGGRVGYEFHCYDPDTTGLVYRVFIDQFKNGKEVSPLSQSPRPMLTCACGHFIYTCEAALHRHGYAELLRADSSEAPDRNPRLKICACKHSLRAVQYLLNKNL